VVRRKVRRLLKSRNRIEWYVYQVGLYKMEKAASGTGS
jgi:hypothetical protein